MSHIIPGKPLEVVGADMFNVHNKNYLCIVDYHSKFPIIKKTEDLAADSLILSCKIIFSEYDLPRIMISDTCGNFLSETFEKFCRKQTKTMQYHHHTTAKAMASWKHASNA